MFRERDNFREGDYFCLNGKSFQVETVSRSSECPTRLFVREVVTGSDGKLRVGNQCIMSPATIYRAQGPGTWTDRQRELYHRDRDFGPNRRPLNIEEERELRTGIPSPNYVAMQQRILEQRRYRR